MDYTPKTYTPAEKAALDREWKALVTNYRRTGELPAGVRKMGTVFGMGAAGDARPEIPVIATVEGVPAAAVLEGLAPAVRYAVDMTLVAVEELQLPAARARGIQVIAPGEGGVATFGANAIDRWDPFTQADLVITVPMQGG